MHRFASLVLLLPVLFLTACIEINITSNIPPTTGTGSVETEVEQDDVEVTDEDEDVSTVDDEDDEFGTGAVLDIDGTIDNDTQSDSLSQN